MSRLVIIGGGITGLSAAYRLQKAAADAGLQITLIESDARLGGKIKTHKADGYVIERGPDSIFTRKPWALQLAQELNLADRVIRVSEQGRTSYVVRNGRLVPAPQGWTQLTPKSIRSVARSRLISLKGKARMAMDLFVPAKRVRGGEAGLDESVGSFFARRLGTEAVEYLADPMLGGIHAGDVNELSMRASHPHFIELERKYGGLIRAAWASQRHAPKTAPSTSSPLFVSFKGGLEELVEHLTPSLKDVEILTGRRVQTINCVRAKSQNPDEPPNYVVQLQDGERITASHIIVTTPAYVTANLLDELSPQASTLLRKIRYESVVTVTLIYDHSHIRHRLNGSGFVVPTREVTSITACTWYSSKWGHSAPPGKVVLRAHLGRTHRPAPLDESDERILAAVQSDLRRLMGVDATPATWWVDRWPMAMPQYYVGHLDLVREIEQSLQQTPDILLAGAAYKGLGLPDCVRQGFEVAESLIERIQAQASRVNGREPA